MLAVLLSAWFLAQFDFFVVNVAAPSLSAQLHAGPVALELVVGGYAFAYASGMVTGGRLGDLFGYRRIFCAGMVAFTAASLLCGLAADSGELIAARLVQGFAGAVMVPQVLAVITAVYPPAGRARAMGWYGVTGGVGSIAGQVLGGLLLRMDVLGLGWRVVFLVNVPVGIAAVLLAARLLPRVAPPRRTALDLPGAAGIAGSLALLLVPLTLGRTAGWPLWTWCAMAAALPAGWLTLRRQRRLTEAEDGQPILDLTLFRTRSFSTGIAAGTAFMAYFASFMFTLTLFLQGGLHLDAFRAGLVFAPMGTAFGLTALLGSRWVARFGRRVMLLGTAVTAIGLVGLAVLGLGRRDLPLLIGALFLIGAGNGLAMPQLIGVALSGVPGHRAGIGSALVTTAQQFAGAAGVAVVGSVFFAVLGGGSDYGAAMQRALFVHLALLAVVAALVAYATRRTSGRSSRLRPTEERQEPSAARSS